MFIKIPYKKVSIEFQLSASLTTAKCAPVESIWIFQLQNLMNGNVFLYPFDDTSSGSKDISRTFFMQFNFILTKMSSYNRQKLSAVGGYILIIVTFCNANVTIPLPSKKENSTVTNSFFYM